MTNLSDYLPLIVWLTAATVATLVVVRLNAHVRQKKGSTKLAPAVNGANLSVAALLIWALG